MEEVTHLMQWIDETMVKYEEKSISKGYLPKDSATSDVCSSCEKIKNVLKKKLVKFNNLTLKKQHNLKIIIYKVIPNLFSNL